MAQKAEQRRQEILDKAKILFLQQGYDETPISSILQSVGIAKGTFYHYFKSKNELLNALVEQMTEQIMEQINPILESPTLSAREKMEQYFETAKNVKTKNVALIRASLQMMYKQSNIKFKLLVDRLSREKIVPSLAKIIDQGRREGSFKAEYSQETASTIVASLQGQTDTLAKEILSENPDPAKLQKYLDFSSYLFNRLLGVQGAPLELYRDIDWNAFTENLKEDRDDTN